MEKKKKTGAYAFYREIKQCIEKYDMIKKGDGVVAGVSGGADSICLLYVLCALQKEYRLRLAVLHVNHGIRGADADADEAFVRRECEKLGVMFHVAHRDVPALAARWGLTQEEAGRRARYEAFHKVAWELGYEKIAVAHNENDNAETFLFQALRGSGIWGLSGIAPLRKEDGHTIIRPLLFVSRTKIERFLAQEGLVFRTDRTNFTGDYARNRIRNELLPAAEEAVNVQAVSHLAQAAAQMYELTGFLRKQVEEVYQSAVKETDRRIAWEENRANKENCAGEKESAANKAGSSENIKKQISIDIYKFKKMPVFLQQEIVLKAIGRAAGSRRDIARVHVETVFGLMRAQTGKRIALPHGVFAFRQYSQIRIEPKEGAGSGELPQFAEINDLVIDAFPKVFFFGEYELNLYLTEGDLADYKTENEKNSLNERNCYTKCFDYGKIENILVLRTKRPGDYILINAGKNKKRIKALFIDMKVPGEYREKLPLLTVGSHVLWAVGVRSSEGFLVTENTKQILVVELRKRGQELQWQKE